MGHLKKTGKAVKNLLLAKPQNVLSLVMPLFHYCTYQLPTTHSRLSIILSWHQNMGNYEDQKYCCVHNA